jgi:hypothetical protein
MCDATTNHTIESSTSSLSQHSISERDPFREPHLLPKTTRNEIYIYPYSGCVIGDGHLKRFPVVINMFKQNVENDSKVNLHISEIDYTLKMCGPSPKESHPSIIVFCTDVVFPDLQRLLTRRYLAEQYYLPRPSHPLSILSRGRTSSKNNSIDSHIPRFKIYFWRAIAIPRILLWGSEVKIKIHQLMDAFPPWSTLCGSTISSYDGSCSTLACLLQIKSGLYGLTVSHAFAHLVKPVSEDVEIRVDSDPDRGATLDEQPIESALEDAQFIVDDVEYESFEADDVQSNTTVLANIQEASRDRRILPPSQGIEASVIIPSNELEILKMPDLDWALVMISEAQNQKPNLYMSGDDVLRPVFLSEVAQHHPGNERDILVICSMQNPKRGILLPGISFIGGINRPGICEVWNIAFPGAQGKLEWCRNLDALLTTTRRAYKRGFRIFSRRLYNK